ncbi:MAG: PIN domain-containing protein [Bacillota bacterium]
MISALMDLENSYMVYPDLNLQVVREDPDDDIFLECALQGRVEVIISGDEHLLKIGSFKGIHILSPVEFLQ